jgi:hypothetical protein
VKLLHGAQIAQLGRKAEVFEMKTSTQLPAEVESRKMGRI